uniref:KIB1-4 beta-propeller domain-containing protein n=1 Tax=Aegilops tauschii TaxID=37682 RepID=N1QRG7_AEGTA
MSSSTVRKRSPAITAATASSGDVSPWTTLHGDLVRLVGWRVLAGDLLDYVHFRAVCPYWRSSTVCPRGHGIVDPRFHPRRWMMLPEGHGLHPREDGKKCFFNLSTGVFVRPRLPLLRDHFVLCPADGLLLVLRPRTYTQDDHPCVLHPFTGDVVELPADLTLPENLRFRLLPINVFAAVSTSPDGVLGVMVAFQNKPFILFASTNDKRWSLSAFPGFRPHPHASPLSFQGQLYMLQEQISSSEVNILRFDPPWQDHSTTLGVASSSLLSPKLVATCPADKFHLPELVECDSEILVVGNKKNYTYAYLQISGSCPRKVCPSKKHWRKRSFD